jgi:hypothetical protein
MTACVTLARNLDELIMRSRRFAGGFFMWSLRANDKRAETPRRGGACCIRQGESARRSMMSHRFA